MATKTKKPTTGPSMSKSALLLSPCVYWASPKARHYDDRFTDTTARDVGVEVHRLIDEYIKEKVAN